MSTAKTSRTPPVQVCPAEIKGVAPGLGWYTDAILFGEMWERPNLPKRDRSFITCSTLITLNYVGQLTGHFNRALTFGIKPTEIVEMVTHLSFYAGWPCAMSAIGVMRQVFEARGVTAEQLTQSLGTAPVAGPDAPAAFEELSQRVIEEDLWPRTELAPRDRSLITICSHIAQGLFGELPVQVRRGLANGLTEADLTEAVSHQAFYAGWARAKTALPIVRAVCKETR